MANSLVAAFNHCQVATMSHKVRKIQDALSDDNAPEVVSHSTSKADAKRNQKALRNFETEEQARRKARNRERDQKLKERARATRGGKAGEKQKLVRFSDESDVDDGDDDVEARMLRAMRDAADEAQSAEGDKGEVDDENKGFGEGMKLSSGSDSSFARDEDDEDAEMSPSLIDEEVLTDDEEMDEDEEDDEAPLQANIRRSSSTAGYLAEDLFAAAFASQNSKPGPQKNKKSTQQQAVKKRRRKSNAGPKDLLIGYVVCFRVRFVKSSMQVQRSYHPHATTSLRSTITSYGTKCPICACSQICRS